MQQAIRTQYLYVNSANRASNDNAYKFTLKIPAGVFACDRPTQFFKLAIQDFSMYLSWYYVNSTNCSFKVNGNGVEYTVTIQQGNYTFKQLASAVQTAMQNVVGAAFSVSVTWDSNLNKLVFQFPQDSNVYILKFNVGNSAYSVLGFNNASFYVADGSGKITSDKPLSTTLSKNICIAVANVTPLKEATNVYNGTSEVCVPARFLLSIVNNFSPFDIISFINQNDLFSMYIKEKQLIELEFNVVDENGSLLTYASDWRASIKIETWEHNTDTSMIEALHDIRDTLKLQLVSGAMGFR